MDRVSFDLSQHERRRSVCNADLGSDQRPVLTRTRTSQSFDPTNSGRSSQPNMASALPTERNGLLTHFDDRPTRRYAAVSPSSTKPRQLSRAPSIGNSLSTYKRRSRRPSRWDNDTPVGPRSGLRTPGLVRSLILNDGSTNERAWYDQFTSTDWVHDSIAEGNRALTLKKRNDLRGRLLRAIDAVEGWILVAIIGCLTAAMAYMIDITEAAVFDLKRGYCVDKWYRGQVKCCGSRADCTAWRTWSEILHPSSPDNIAGNYVAFILGCISFASVACFLTLMSKTVVPLNIASTFDEDLGAVRYRQKDRANIAKAHQQTAMDDKRAVTYYPTAGSGVAEVKVILSGFVLHGYLGLRTLILKSIALIFSVASGMSLGKEGPYVHIAACIGNIACRFVPKYNLNDGKRREIITAATASGVAVAFGSPLGGVLFSLEEVSYYYRPQTLFRTFFCCIAAAVFLKFLNPYGTNKIVIFEVRYLTDWRWFELFTFAFLGLVGGLAGALFIKASRFWATTFRRLKWIKANPSLEVLLVALTTGLLSFWNRYANVAVTELLFEVASPCRPENESGLCPKSKDDIPQIIKYLLVAFIIKSFLTVITFGIKVPAGIYVPSRVCGGLMGRIVGHLIQYAALSWPDTPFFGTCSVLGDQDRCVTPGAYALVAAGATMCGVTRLSITLVVILFELTGSLNHVLPFAIGVLMAKWTADFVEPYSIYDLLIDMNSYPLIESRHVPLFDTATGLGDITPRFRGERIIDISISPYVRASELRAKLDILHGAGEFDGGLPIIREKALVGFIAAPDLEFALDKVEEPEEKTLCLLSHSDRFVHASDPKRWVPILDDDDADDEQSLDSISVYSDRGQTEQESTFEADFVSYVDSAPVSLEVHSPLNLVYQLFSRLGLRYICVVEAGEYRGMVHKKLFVKYMKQCEAKHV